MSGKGPIRIGDLRWWLDPRASREAALPRVKAAMEAHARGEAPNLRTGEAKRLHALRLGPGHEADHLLKANTYRFVPGLLRILRPSKSRRELRLAAAAAARGLPVPVPLAAGEQRRLGRLLACYLLIPILPDVTDLRRLWFDARPVPARRRALTQALGELSRRAHAAGLFQDDFAPNNFLVRESPSPEIMLVDFERARLGRRPATAAMRRWMLAKLSRHVDDATAAERMRFLRAYARGDRREARRWWTEVAAFAPRLARRDHRRMRRNCTRDGRNFAVLRRSDGFGYARRSAAGRALPPPPSGPGGTLPRARASGAFWCVEYGRMGRRRGAEIWARANTLWSTGRLIPEPLAWLQGREGAVLVLARGSEDLLADTRQPDAAAAEVRVLARRLGAVAAAAQLPPDAIAVGPVGRWPRRALLLRPDLVVFDGRRDRPEALAALAGRLLSDARSSSPGPSSPRARGRRP